MKRIEINKIKRTSQGNICFPKATTPIDNDNWNYPADVDVKFGIAYDDNNLYLKYTVNELHPKAICTTTNGKVWEDSCVEFFIAFDNSGYYNLEFNCIGTRLVGYGTSNKDRGWLDKELVERINTNPSIRRQPIDIEDTATAWELEVIIPKEVFGNKLSYFEVGKSFKVNFYKCGDNQKQVHFLSWSPINNETPNFHLPKYFGEMILK